MTITGPVRRYIIPLPNNTKTYEYPIQVELTGADGQKTQLTTTLKIKGGSAEEVKITADENLHMTLAGN